MLKTRACAEFYRCVVLRADPAHINDEREKNNS
jgi:hypothetical protein